VGKPDGGELSQPSGAGRGDEGQNGHRVLVPLAAAEPAKAELEMPPEEPKPANRTASETTEPETAARKRRGHSVKSEAKAKAKDKRKVKATKTAKANKPAKASRKKEKPADKAA